MNLEKEISALLVEPDRAPSAELAHYACEQGWIGIHHRNWCINVDGTVFTDEKQRVFLREVCYYIFRGYLLALRKP